MIRPVPAVEQCGAAIAARWSSAGSPAASSAAAIAARLVAGGERGGGDCGALIVGLAGACELDRGGDRGAPVAELELEVVGLVELEVVGLVVGGKLGRGGDRGALVAELKVEIVGLVGERSSAWSPAASSAAAATARPATESANRRSGALMSYII